MMSRKLVLLISLFLGTLGVPMQAQAQNMIIVSPEGGDFSDPISALQAIGSRLPRASVDNPYVIKVLPGVYKTTQPIVMKEYVDLEGSGVNTTMIVGDVSWQFGNDSLGMQGIINAASHSEIRHLSVQNVHEKSSAIGVAMLKAEQSLITDVHTVASGFVDNSANWKYGVRILDSQNIQLHKLVARGSAEKPTTCQGLVVRNSAVVVSDSELIGAGSQCTISIGLAADDGSTVILADSRAFGAGDTSGFSLSVVSTESAKTTVRARHSVLTGDLLTRQPLRLSRIDKPTLWVSHSQFDGNVLGNAVCFSVHNIDLQGLNRKCAF